MYEMIGCENIIDLSVFKKRYVGNAASPFRYPGGKGFLTPFLQEQLGKRFGQKKASYAEPYCGGAGSALNLLVDGDVDHLYLNDADFRIYSAWRAILLETDRFIERLTNTTPSISEWETNLQKLYERQASEYDFDIGFAAFFVNRTSRSGVILGSGPIGGYAQCGKWKIDARFNKTSLAKKISQIGSLRDRITMTCLDGLAFCKKLEGNRALAQTLLFVDPPYVHAGGRLYFDGMSLSKHDALAEWLLSGVAPHWILTYDDHPVVRENFASLKEHRIQVQYSLGRRRLEKELLYMTDP
jgi:DNA adenine methylase